MKTAIVCIFLLVKAIEKILSRTEYLMLSASIDVFSVLVHLQTVFCWLAALQ